MILAAHALALTLAASPVVAQVDAIAARTGLAGEILVARGDRVLVEKGYGPIAPDGARRHRAGQRWRLASITKQVVASMIVAQSARTGVSLDAPLVDPALGGLTLHQVLTHHTGLANPDATPSLGGMPAYYQKATPDLAYCRSQPAKPGAEFAYNNCDYLIAGETLGRQLRWPAGMRMAGSAAGVVPGYVAGKPEPRFSLASFGTAGALTGTARDVFRFDRTLMTGRLMPDAARAALWTPEGGRSYQALGQWVFPGTLKGCTAPKRIVQRDGEIGGIQTRNFILPDDDLVVVVFINRSSDDFAIGEVWQGSGFAHDLLSAVACT